MATLYFDYAAMLQNIAAELQNKDFPASANLRVQTQVYHFSYFSLIDVTVIIIIMLLICDIQIVVQLSAKCLINDKFNYICCIARNHQRSIIRQS